MAASAARNIPVITTCDRDGSVVDKKEYTLEQLRAMSEGPTPVPVFTLLINVTHPDTGEVVTGALSYNNLSNRSTRAVIKAFGLANVVTRKPRVRRKKAEGNGETAPTSDTTPTMAATA